MTTTTTTFTWNVASSLPTAIEVGAYAYVYGPAGTPIEQIGPSGSVLTYLAGRQGSTVALTDATDQVVASYAYDPFGSLRCGPPNQATTPCQPTPPTPASCPVARAAHPSGSPPCLGKAIAANRFFYDGQYLDATSGLYYLRSRWYDPQTAQFTSVDPLVAITGAAYGYAGNNPVNGSDPLGLFCADALDPFSSGFGQCWSSGYKKARNDVAHGTVGVCISGVIGAGPGGVGQVCFVESQGFKHAGFTETLGGGGQSPAAGLSFGLQFSNAKSPNDLGGLFGYANGSVVIGPDAGVTAGGSGFVGENSCNRTIAGANVDVGLGAKFPLPGSAGAGVSNTWVQNLW